MNRTKGGVSFGFDSTSSNVCRLVNINMLSWKEFFQSLLLYLVKLFKMKARTNTFNSLFQRSLGNEGFWNLAMLSMKLWNVTFISKFQPTRTYLIATYLLNQSSSITYFHVNACVTEHNYIRSLVHRNFRFSKFRAASRLIKSGRLEQAFSLWFAKSEGYYSVSARRIALWGLYSFNFLIGFILINTG